jgi:hypothetical protein
MAQRPGHVRDDSPTVEVTFEVPSGSLRAFEQGLKIRVPCHGCCRRSVLLSLSRRGARRPVSLMQERVRRHRLQTVDTRVCSLCTLLIDGSGRIHPGYKGSGPLARADPGWTSAISHVHGNFHAEAKIGSLRSFPFHFQSPFIPEVIEYLAV